MKITTLAPSSNRGDHLIEGYCIQLDGKQFRIFVMEELTGTQRGYILKLMLGWGDDTSVDLHRHKSQYPEATELMKCHLPDAWVNKGRVHHCYKYIVFGHGKQNKDLALKLLRTIINEQKSKKGDQQ